MSKIVSFNAIPFDVVITGYEGAGMKKGGGATGVKFIKKYILYFLTAFFLLSNNIFFLIILKKKIFFENV